MRMPAFTTIGKSRGAGFSLIEVVIGAAVILFSVMGLAGAYTAYLAAGLGGTAVVQESLLLEEGLEAVRSMRDEGFSENIAPLSADTPHFLEWNGSRFVATATEEIVDGSFTRRFVLENVYRDGNDDIAASGTLDENTRKVTVFVERSGRHGSTTRSLSMYLTNLFGD